MSAEKGQVVGTPDPRSRDTQQNSKVKQHWLQYDWIAESFSEANLTYKFWEIFSKVGQNLKPKAKPEGRQVYPSSMEGRPQNLCAQDQESLYSEYSQTLHSNDRYEKSNLNKGG